MKKRVALIGHRGVGKTSLLLRIASYLGEHAICLDLDREIRARSGLDIQEVFATQGEAAFREIERQTFRAIDEETASSTSEVYVAIGAGFDPAEIPATWQALWIRRATDEAGRIFMDRPRLNANVTALEEYQERYRRRTPAYRERADCVLWLDEGIDETFDPAERAFFKNEIRELGAALTILPENIRSEAAFTQWTRERLAWGIELFELRDDLLTEEQFALAGRLLPRDKTLVSFRDPKRRSRTNDFTQDRKFDWPLEMGRCETGEPFVYSLHERREGESISQCLARFESIGKVSLLKAALPTHSLAELMEGERWQKEDPGRRSFLPLSTDGSLSGQWAWYRLRQLSRQPLNFIREGEGSGADQPTLLQAAREPRGATFFAAVLGDPVRHSRTPMEHREFFSPQSPVYSIRITLEDMREGALQTLNSLGLRWAAVTAPLKEVTFSACHRTDETAKMLKAVNTLIFTEGGIEGANTDLAGLASSTSHLSLGEVAVWGGGGTLNVIREVFPDAQFYSLRTGQLREGSKAASEAPHTVIWAVGRWRADVNQPPQSWAPERVIDLNYADDSPGRTFALSRGAKYISGLAMFRAQAEAQRQFWKKWGDGKK